jgi:hypothetical protein
MYTQERLVTLDIETNLAWDTIWFAVVRYPSGATTTCNTVAELHQALSGVDCVMGPQPDRVRPADLEEGLGF